MNDTLPPEQERPRWRLPFTWIGLLAVCFVVYELTRNPALGAVIVCLKFGWEDFRAAFWLYANDPEPWRRRATLWLYLGWGMWKTAIVAFVMTAGFVMVRPLGVPAPGAPLALLWAFASTFLTAVVAILLASLLTAVAAGIAWRGGVRLWLDSAVHRARRWDHWPPAAVCAGRENRLHQPLLTALAIGGLSVLAAMLDAVNRLGHLAGGLVAFGLAISAPVAFLLTRDLLTRALFARSPYECWWEAAPNESPGREERTAIRLRPRSPTG
jgi:hypothetical protein